VCKESAGPVLPYTALSWQSTQMTCVVYVMCVVPLSLNLASCHLPRRGQDCMRYCSSCCCADQSPTCCAACVCCTRVTQCRVSDAFAAAYLLLDLSPGYPLLERTLAFKSLAVSHMCHTWSMPPTASGLLCTLTWCLHGPGCLVLQP
jgi:hypothetical protein